MVEISQIICERLECIKMSPNLILNVSEEFFNSPSATLLQDVYPHAKVIKNLEDVNKVDFIFGVVHLEPKDFFHQFPMLLLNWKNNLSSGGLIMLGLINPAAEIFEMGDCLAELGYKNVVIDKEMLDEHHFVVYIHAWKAIPASVKISQIRRL